MKKNRKKVLWGCLLLAICVVPLSCKSNSKSDFTFKNASGKLIKKAEVNAGGQRIFINRIEPGGKFSFSFTVRGDSSYLIKVEFADGQTLECNDGYLTNGVVNHDTITVNENNIVVVSAPEINR